MTDEQAFRYQAYGHEVGQQGATGGQALLKQDPIGWDSLAFRDSTRKENLGMRKRR